MLTKCLVSGGEYSNTYLKEQRGDSKLYKLPWKLTYENMVLDCFMWIVWTERNRHSFEATEKSLF